MTNVYLLRFKGEVLRGYIGITTRDLENRKLNHLKDTKKHITRKTKWLKRGLKKNKELIIESLGKFTKIEALSMEKVFIKKYLDKGYKLYNSNEGGGGILKHSQETKDKISQTNKGRKLNPEQVKRRGDFNSGKKASLETRLRMSISQRGKKLSEEHKQKLRDNHKGNTGKKFTEEHRVKISLANKGRKFGPATMESRLKKSGINNKNSKPVKATNIITGDILEYASVGDAFRDLRSKGIILGRTSIYKNIARQNNSSGGYKWEYL